MVHFGSDYMEGAHESLLAQLSALNRVSMPGYGGDPYTAQAQAKIIAACERPEAQVFFLVGGTQTNATVTAALLRDYEGVIAADTGHVSVHESGAIEYTGHKVLTLPGREGKLWADDIAAYLEAFWAEPTCEHMVIPGMVYLSYPTELGTLYTKAELTAIYAVCQRYQLPLYIDGARLGYGLMSDAADMTLADIARLCDVFYIGGTKVGAWFGEAVVFTHGNMPAHFLTIAKQHGALLAKGFLLGAQFDALFTDHRYFTIARHAIDLAKRVKDGVQALGYSLWMDSPTNQQFVIVTKAQAQALAANVVYSVWMPYDEERVVIRLVTSWATTEAAVDELLQHMAAARGER